MKKEYRCFEIPKPLKKTIKVSDYNKVVEQRDELLEFAIEMVKRYPNSPWIYEQGNKAIKKATS